MNTPLSEEEVMKEVTRRGKWWRRAPMIALSAILMIALVSVSCTGRTSDEALPVSTQESSPVERLRVHVHMLAGDIGERNLSRPQALRDAAAYIESVWREQGYEVVRHEYEVSGEKCANLEVTRHGKDKPGEIILIGAHYDSIRGSPGANDNASGVAAMLEISRRLATIEPNRTIRFVAFVNEEPPYFLTPLMGSRVYARMARARGDDIRAMVSLETMGYYSAEPGSQRLPDGFQSLYPDRGEFIMFASNMFSRPFLKEAVGLFRKASDVPVEVIATDQDVPGVAWSDHGSFWGEGYPAIMVTDTALYRYPYYHTSRDTPNKVNYDVLARLTKGLYGMLVGLKQGH